jgi:hypothetical protein
MKEKGKFLMIMSSAAKYALGVTAAAAMLAGCSSGASSIAPTVGGSQSALVRQAKANGVHALNEQVFLAHGPAAATLSRVGPLAKAKKAGLYASEFYGTTIYGYAATGKGSPTCTISGVGSVNNIASDGKADLIDPDGASRTIIVYAPNCGKIIGTISDTVGQPADAASADAATGTIAVGNIFDTSDTPASISVCTVKKGCTANLTNPGINELAGVAMDLKGNCWGDAINSSGTATLTYFKGCAGKGVAATGFVNSSFGGLDIDTKGNLVAVDFDATALYVYSGCNPKCKKVSGPLPLHGEAVFGHLNEKGTMFASGDFTAGAVDLYKYTPTSLKYTTSVTEGLSSSLDVEGTAYAPRSKE